MSAEVMSLFVEVLGLSPNSASHNDRFLDMEKSHTESTYEIEMTRDEHKTNCF